MKDLAESLQRRILTEISDFGDFIGNCMVASGTHGAEQEVLSTKHACRLGLSTG